MELSLEPSPAPLIAYEVKICEFCGSGFMRQIGTKEKYCKPCIPKQSQLYWIERKRHGHGPQRKAYKEPDIQRLREQWLDRFVPKFDYAQHCR